MNGLEKGCSEDLMKLQSFNQYICEKRFFIHTHQKGQRHLFTGGKNILFFNIFHAGILNCALDFLSSNPSTKYAKLKHTVLKDSEKLFICHFSVLLVPYI